MTQNYNECKDVCSPENNCVNRQQCTAKIEAKKQSEWEQRILGNMLFGLFIIASIIGFCWIYIKGHF